MRTKSMIGPALFSLAMLAATPALAADADPSIHQVYEAAEAGRFEDAQAMMDKVLHDHPNSAKAHYVEAELLAKQNRLRDAQTELNTAERLDPAVTFANRQKVQELQSRISGAHQTVQRMQPAYAQQVAPVGSRNNGGWGITVLIVIGLIMLFLFIVRALGRRETVIASGGYPAYGPGAAYGPGGVPPSYGPGMMGQGGGGIGSGILGGLATGAAVGAGIVAGEELMHHFTDHDRRNDAYDDRLSNNVSYNAPPDDMGGNDFGVSDSSSWDSGGGGGSDDWS